MIGAGIAFLSWKYLSYRPLRTLTLVAAVALTIYLPFALQVFISESTRILQERARSTPLLVGPRGSSIDLVLNSLYFTPQALPPLQYSAYTTLEKKAYGINIPLHVRFKANTAVKRETPDGETAKERLVTLDPPAPIVGTSLEYFQLRDLGVAEGRMVTRIGDCVIGARLAKEFEIGSGDHIISETETTFALDGAFPLRMRITGVLAPNHTPDDQAVFVDLKTAWIIEGLAHGHQDLAKPGAAGMVRERDGDLIRATSKVFQYAEVTEDNLASFHFHGDSANYPITAVVLLPGSRKFPDPEQARNYAHDDYDNESKTATEQIVVPLEAVNKLTATLFATRKMVLAAFVVLGIAALGLVALVFLLSFRLREREMLTYAKIGATEFTLLILKFTEVAIVLAAGIVLAFAAVRLTESLAADLLPKLLN